MPKSQEGVYIKVVRISGKVPAKSLIYRNSTLIPMAELTDGTNTAKVEDGAEVKEGCKELGVVFGCEDGLCGTCLVEVMEGMDNLSERTQAEKDMGVEDNNRLMCQCKIKGGRVKILY